MTTPKRDILMDFMVGIGENVRKQRLAKKITMEALGKELGVEKTNINRIEAGYNITVTTILKLALALDIEPYKLLQVDLIKDEKDLEKMVNINKASKIKKGEPKIMLSMSEKEIKTLATKTGNKDLIKASMDLFHALKDLKKKERE